MVIRKVALIQNNRADKARLEAILNATGCEPAAAADGADLLGYLTAGCDAAFVDTDTIDIWDKDFLARLRGEAPDVPLVLTLQPGRVESYVAMLSTGAWDYLSQPFTEESVLLLLRRIDEQKTLLEQNRYLWAELEKVRGRPKVLTRDPRMIEIFRQVGKVARTDAAVLILGEQGTEKAKVARLIHNASDRKTRPFVQIDCSQPDEQVAERLVGRNTRGPWALAAGGSVLLDEVLRLSPRMQASLLRALEAALEAALEDTASAARLVCTSSVDPYEEIDNGNFRSDLFFRLNSAQIFLPPLRERAADIPLLAADFMDELGMTRPDAGWDELAEYDWPGNLNELEAAVRLAALRMANSGNAADALLPRVCPRRKGRRRFPGA